MASRSRSSAFSRARECLRTLDELRAPAFLVGDASSLADLHAYPILRFLQLAPDGRPELDAFARLGEWMSRVAQRPTIRATRAS